MPSPVFAVAIALLAQAPAGGAPQTATAPAATQPPATSNVVCRSEMETGTRFSHRICHTPQEWRAISSAATDSTSKMQQLGGMTGGPH